MSWSFVALGFLFGIRHALEADHVAAVTSLASRSPSLREHVRLAVFWGLGHAGTVLVAGVLALLAGLAIPPVLSRAFETAVGIMLVLLGADVLWRARRRRIHLHAHRHRDGRRHVHFHAHELAPERPHPFDHDHPHPRAARAAIVGAVHGLAGSAGLVVLAAERASSAVAGLGAIAAFGAGSIAGMVLFAAAISSPLRRSLRSLGRMPALVERGVGGATLALGLWIAAAALFGGS